MFFLALQLTDNWLNQSACCLFNYIMQCPLVAATRDITNEIAQVSVIYRFFPVAILNKFEGLVVLCTDSCVKDCKFGFNTNATTRKEACAQL